MRFDFYFLSFLCSGTNCFLNKTLPRAPQFAKDSKISDAGTNGGPGQPQESAANAQNQLRQSSQLRQSRDQILSESDIFNKNPDPRAENSQGCSDSKDGVEYHEENKINPMNKGQSGEQPAQKPSHQSNNQTSINTKPPGSSQNQSKPSAQQSIPQEQPKQKTQTQ